MKDLEQLLADLRDDEDLRAQFAALNGDEAAVNEALAKAGYDVAVADIVSYTKQIHPEELDEDVLRGVAGGIDNEKAIEVLSGIATAEVGIGFVCWT